MQIILYFIYRVKNNEANTAYKEDNAWLYDSSSLFYNIISFILLTFCLPKVPIIKFSLASVPSVVCSSL